MEGQRAKARAGSAFTRGEELSWHVEDRQELNALKDDFQGYDTTVLRDLPVALQYDDRPAYATVLHQGQSGWIVLPKTPFYIESGGQVSDRGWIEGPKGKAEVDRLQRIPGQRSDFPRAHRVRVTEGELRLGDIVTAQVDPQVRQATRRNHTATHLLQAALRQVLGNHVKQAGSLVAPDRLRFDFVHFSALTADERLRIEQIVNEQILNNTPLHTEVKGTAEAIAAGATALFGEKYGDTVRVVSIPGFSQELCGGTHVRATGDIGLFAIVSEGGVAAGVRRIEAITGLDALKTYQENRDRLDMMASMLNLPANAPPNLLGHKLTTLQDEQKRLTRELQQAKLKAAFGSGGAVAGSGAGDDAIDVAGVKLVAREVAGLDKDGLRALVDQHRSRIKSGVVVLASPTDGKVAIVVGVTPDLVKRVPAGQVVKLLAPIVGGGGGGRPDFAEAGGKDASKVAEMLAASRGVIEKMLTG